MSAPVTDPAMARPTQAPLLALEGVDVVLGRGWRANHVLSEVDLKIWPGEIVGLVGETGSGKTTLARTVVGLVRPRKGRVTFHGAQISGLGRGASRRERRSGHVQLVFQDPLRSLDPDLTVAQIVGEGLRIRGGLDEAEIEQRAAGALAKVGLDPTLLRRTPGQISGGQRQRVSIARALAVDPELLLCDEPVSALDASNRNYILRLLGDLRDDLGLPIVIISHDLSSLAGIADRVVVLYRGRIVEDGPVAQVFTAPRHPYTALLMASAPSVQHDRPLSVHQLRRAAADPVPPSGDGACVFAARCPFAIDACAGPATLCQCCGTSDVSPAQTADCRGRGIDDHSDRAGERSVRSALIGGDDQGGALGCVLEGLYAAEFVRSRQHGHPDLARQAQGLPDDLGVDPVIHSLLGLAQRDDEGVDRSRGSAPGRQDG